MMKKNRNNIISIILAFVFTLMTCMPGGVYAASKWNVKFFTDMSCTNLYQVQQVSDLSHPNKPSPDPPAYEEGTFRWVFKGWYWMVDDNPEEYSFTLEEYAVFLSDQEIFAQYTPYLSENYVAIINNEFVEDYDTPWQTILKRYSGTPSVSFVLKSEFEHGGGSNDPNHEHSYSYNDPSWKWISENGEIKAKATYTCSCGDTAEETVTPTYSDNRGVRTYTAADSHGNRANKTENLTYTVTVDSVPETASYHWGDKCTLTANGPKKWYIGTSSGDRIDSNLVADGVDSYTFIVTKDISFVTIDTAVVDKPGIVSLNMVSDSEGIARIQASWSLPSEADITSVKVYRGFKKDDSGTDASALIQRGTEFDSGCRDANGELTLNLTGLKPTRYQYSVIVIDYEIDGVQQPQLVSDVVEVLSNGANS